jgi:hypothetical protein
VIAIVRGILKFFSERGYGPPYVNCVEAAACDAIRWAGWDIPSDYSKTLRTLSGVPIYDANGNPQGTSFNDLKVALQAAFPTAWAQGIFHFTGVTWPNLVQLLPVPGRRNAHRCVVEVTVDCSKLPRYMKVYVGQTYNAGHALGIGAWRMGASVHDSTKFVEQVFVLDPMGKPWTGYDGSWVDAVDLKPAINTGSAGAYRVFYCLRNTAVN